MFDPRRGTAEAARTLLARSMRPRLDRGEFDLAYQPIVQMRRGTVSGAEALARWDHPRLDPRRPDEFIELAEDSGFIVDLGLWVLEQAFGTARTWPAGMFVSVNLSVRQLREAGVVDTVRDILGRSGLAPGRLQFELTETMLMESAGGAVDALRGVADFGVGIVIDDFGTGWPNFAYLRSIPVRGLKLSKEFVEKLGRDPAGRQPAMPPSGLPGLPPSGLSPSSRLSDAQPAAGDLVRAIVTFAHSLGLSVTAEGIETPDQATSLRGFGTDLGQGHLFGEAMIKADFARWVLRNDHAGSGPAWPAARQDQALGTAAMRSVMSRTRWTADLSAADAGVVSEYGDLSARRLPAAPGPETSWQQPMYLDVERCVRAVRSGETRFDRWLFTAVVTTGIYCRPSCPAVPPKAGNMRFYPSAAAAQQAGAASPGPAELSGLAQLPGLAALPGPADSPDRTGPLGVASVLSLRLPFRGPLCPDNLFGHLAATSVPGVEEWRDGAYRRTLRLPNGHGFVTLRPPDRDGRNHVTSELALTDLRDLATAIARCRRLLDLDNRQRLAGCPRPPGRAARRWSVDDRDHLHAWPRRPGCVPARRSRGAAGRAAPRAAGDSHRADPPCRRLAALAVICGSAPVGEM